MRGQGKGVGLYEGCYGDLGSRNWVTVSLSLHMVGSYSTEQLMVGFVLEKLHLSAVQHFLCHSGSGRCLHLSNE